MREKETSLASVLERLLTVPDHWATFADRYLEALDEVAARSTANAPSGRRPPEAGRDRLTGQLAGWHALLLDRLFGGGAEDRLDRLAAHPGLGGPDLSHFQAQLALRRGDLPTARRLVTAALERLPGHQGYLALAAEIGAPLPDRAREVARARLAQPAVS